MSSTGAASLSRCRDGYRYIMRMTDRDVTEVEPQEPGHWSKWIAWPVSAALAAGGALGFYNDAVEAKVEWLYWVVVLLVTAFYVVVAVIYVVRLTRWARRRWVAFANKARNHDALETELATWKISAGEATARAVDAEARLSTWHLDTLKEGRRRVLAEIRGLAARTEFHDIEVGVADEMLIVGARWSGEVPAIDSRYVIRSATLKQHKAVLECVEIRQNGTVVFRVPSVASDGYRSDLLARARATGGVLTDVEISPRTDDLEEEAIWPEN